MVSVGCGRRFVRLLGSAGESNIRYIIRGLRRLIFFRTPTDAEFRLGRRYKLIVRSLGIYRATLGVQRAVVKVGRDLHRMFPRSDIVVTTLLRSIYGTSVCGHVVGQRGGGFNI